MTSSELPGPAELVGGVRSVEVTESESDLRLDRWFRRHFPQLGHGQLERLLRTGQVRVDGRRARAGLRLAAGQVIRVPPLPEPAERPGHPSPEPPSREEEAALLASILYRDDDLIAIDKPPGLAVQGGIGMVRHLDAMLDVLRFGRAERPRLVHRLDKDTSGVLLLARDARAAGALAAAFREHRVRKLYWAIVVGVPAPVRGRIDLPLSKPSGRAGERVAPDDAGQRAVTDYAVVERAGKRAAWLALAPATGRTHQLRAHCVALGTPILGDGKYAGAAAFLPAPDLSRQLHLHARRLDVPHPRTGRRLGVVAPLPPHMAASWAFFGFDPDAAGDPFDG